MTDLDFEEALLAAIPSRAAWAQLRAQVDLRDEARDIYLAYGGAALRLTGLLITERANIDELVAFCPIHPDLGVATASWRLDLRRQFTRAIATARDRNHHGNGVDVFDLRYVNDALREVPAWIYSTTCIPLTYEWSGTLLHPRPFCPVLFEHMARKPQASRWLEQRQRAMCDPFPPHTAVSSEAAENVQPDRCASANCAGETR